MPCGTSASTDRYFFLTGPFRLPAPGAGADGRYARFLRTAAEHRPLASVALSVRREGDFCVDARLAVGASTPIPARLHRAEALLSGKAVTAELAAEAAGIVAADINAVSDMRGTEDFRRHIVRTVARRTIAELFGVAAGQVDAAGFPERACASHGSNCGTVRSPNSPWSTCG